MSPRFRNLLTHPKFWRIVGFVSSVIGTLCYALSVSFEHVGDRYHILKISLYGAVSITIIFVMLFAKKGIRFIKSFRLKALVGVLALILTSSYNFFSDEDSNEKNDILNLISNGSFALTLLSLSKQIDLGCEGELLSFYLGCLTIQLMKINMGFVLVGAGYCYLLNVLHFYSGSHFQLEINGVEAACHEEHVAIEIDNAKEEEREAKADHIGELYSILGIGIKSDEGTVLYPQDLEAKLMEAMASGFEKELCSHVFCGWRRQFLEGKVLKELVSNEEVQKLPLKYLKGEIERWNKAFKDAFKTLFPCERHLCDRVFGFSPFSDTSFMEICKEPTMQLLNFANAVASTSRSPERLFKILLVFETLNDLLPDLKSMFSGDDQCCMVNEAVRICKSLRGAIRGVFMELENLIRQNPGRVVVYGGGLHPTNHYVMNYLFAACEYWKTLELAFDDEVSPNCCGLLSLQVAQILELLGSNLKASSKIYKDSSLCYIFMMNNWWYIVHKVKRCELRKVLGDDWIQKHIAKMGQYLVNYQRSSWDKVLEMLNVDNNESLALGDIVAVESLKEKLEVMKMKFEEICQVQATWVVIDDQLREVMKSSLKKILLPAFESFITRFQNAIDPSGDDIDAQVDFGVVLDVAGLAALIDKLFQEKDEHVNPRIIQPTWTVVLPSTQDFHEWRKYDEKTILNSTYSRKYYRCIYKNDQGCRARKHVQQIQENPKMYTTSYSGFHTCTVLNMLQKAP